MKKEEQAKKVQKVIAKAWADEAFKQKLIARPADTLREEGMEVPSGVELRVVESTDKVTYLVLPPKPSDLSIDEVEIRLAAWGDSSTSF